MRRELKIALVIGFVSRLLVSPFFAHPWDMYIWIRSGELALQNLNIYVVGNPVDYPWGFYAYPPTWLYWLMAVTIMAKIIGSLMFQVFLIKLPIIVADILVGYLIYRVGLLVGLGEDRSFKASLIWLFNPITFFMSSVWGMFDSISVLFMLLGIHQLIRGRYVNSGILFGVGASVKLFPALMIPPAVIYLVYRSKQASIKEAILNIILPSLVTFTILSTPFLSTPIEYFTRILQHTKSVGSFTYWVLLSNLVNLSSFWFIYVIIFLAGVIIAYRRFRGSEWNEFINMSAATMAIFLAVSPKVNIQYLLTLFPLLTLSKNFWKYRQLLLNYVIIVVAGTVWIASSTPIFSNYSLDYLGRIFIPQTYEFGVAGILFIAMAVFAGSRFIVLALHYVGFRSFDIRVMSRWSVLAILLIFSMMLSIFPTPLGVSLPKTPIRIAIPESVDAAFIPGSEASVDNYLENYDINYVVLSFSPDFINTYEGYRPERDLTMYLRFKTGSNPWLYRDLAWLVQALKERGVKPLLGVYLRVEQVKTHYGVHGFLVNWTTSKPEILGAGNLLLFNTSITVENKSMPYSEFFAERIGKIIRDFGFEGVYLMSWYDWRIGKVNLSHVIPLLSSIRGQADLILVESADSTNDIRHIHKLLQYADYVVLKTAPWINTVYYARVDNVTLTDYEMFIRRVLKTLGPSERARLLYSLYVFDFVEGWATPAAEIQVEANRFYSLGLRSGYAIYYASRYVPYKVTVSEMILESLLPEISD